MITGTELKINKVYAKNQENYLRKLKSPTFINPLFKKGNFFKREGNTYIIIEIKENDSGVMIGYCLRVKNKFNRFDIKHQALCNKMQSDIFTLEDFSIDERDKAILNDFIKFINETDFNIRKNDYWHYKFNIYENLSKFKKYKF